MTKNKSKNLPFKIKSVKIRAKKGGKNEISNPTKGAKD